MARFIMCHESHAAVFRIVKKGEESKAESWKLAYSDAMAGNMMHTVPAASVLRHSWARQRRGTIKSLSHAHITLFTAINHLPVLIRHLQLLHSLRHAVGTIRSSRAASRLSQAAS